MTSVSYPFSPSLWVRVLPRNGANGTCGCIERDGFKEVAFVIVETDKTTLCSVGGWLETQGRVVAIWFWRPFPGRISSSPGRRLSIDCMGPTHPHYGRLLALLKGYWLKCSSLLKNNFTETPRTMFDDIPEHHGLATLTQNINHHMMQVAWLLSKGHSPRCHKLATKVVSWELGGCILDICPRW